MRTVYSILLFLLLIFPLSSDELRHVGQFGRKGRDKGEFSAKTILDFSPSGEIVVLDRTLVSVQKLTVSGDNKFKISTQKTPEGTLALVSPTDLAVSSRGYIYVTDWETVHIAGTKNPKIFNHSPCIHKFSADGNFIDTIRIHDLRQILKIPKFARQQYLSRHPDLLLNAYPSLDTDGNYALFVPQGSTGRPFHICIDQDENIYVSDDEEIHKFSADGKPVWLAKTAQAGVGQVIEIGDMAVDSKGNLYLLDQKAHRVIKYDTSGKFQLSFGCYGDRPGELIQPFYLSILSDDTLLVADKAVYKKDFATQLPRRQFDPFRYGGTVNRIFRTRIKRIQKFSPIGKYRGNILIRLNREKVADLFLQLKAIDPNGFVYLVDSDTLQIHRYQVARPFLHSGLQAEVKFRFIDSYDNTIIDNEDDLDADIAAGGEYETIGMKNKLNNDLLFAYDINQDIRLSLTNGLSWESKISDTWFRGPQYSDFRGSFPMDTRDQTKTIKNKISLDFTCILNHNPYNYREAGANAFIELTDVGMKTEAWDKIRNQMLTLVNQNVFGWGAGTYYDLGRSFRFRFNIEQMSGKMHYTAADPTGIPAAEGMSNRPAPLSKITMFLDGEF